MFLRGKAMMAQAEEMLDILKDVMLGVRLDNRERFRQMVLEAKARQEHYLVPAGHEMVNLRLRAHFSEAGWAAEQMKGISYLFFLRQLADRMDSDWPGVLSDLEEIRSALINRRYLTLNATLDEPGWRTCQSMVDAFLDVLPSSDVSMMSWNRAAGDEFEAMTIPSQINYVGKGARLYDLGYRYHGSSHVISHYLRNAWLWERVRVLGGAYGAFCMFDRLSGVLTFVSYRDPHLMKTLDAFDETSAFLGTLELKDEELTKGIIGTIGNIDQYQLPDARGYTSMVRYLSGQTDEDRQRMREDVLMTRQEDFRSFARVLEGVKDRGLVKVLGSKGKLEETLSQRPGWLREVNVL
ncbi:MAG: hypothetical protein JRL30_27540 [Deltaproteobacteria bacterium]|nr:hypothetical protein [Deltaproteobacteria bacterium]